MQHLARSYIHSALQVRLVVGISVAVVFNGIYCLAYRYSSGNPATLFEAFSWGVINIAPWIAAVEIGRSFSRFWHIMMFLFAAAIVSLFLETLITLNVPSLFDVVRRVPGGMIAMTALVAFAFISKRNGRPKRLEEADALSVSCDWVRSAGNYVELHINGCHPKLVRTTLARVTEELQPKLVRIHRRYAVFPAAIERIERKHVLLNDGVRLPVGDRYRIQLSHLEALVPSSQSR